MYKPHIFSEAILIAMFVEESLVREIYINSEVTHWKDMRIQKETLGRIYTSPGLKGLIRVIQYKNVAKLVIAVSI